MKKLIILFLLFFIPVNAEIVTASGKHKHLGNVAANESCNIAEEKAKKNAIIQSLGQTVSSDVVSNCSEIDGEYECERNQFALFELNGDITSFNRTYTDEGKELGSDIRFCEVQIEAKVVPIDYNQDPNFQFDVGLNKKIYRTGDLLEININTSKEMYLSIFQWLPYGGNKYNKVTKIFPNEDFNKITNNLIKDNLNLKYEVYFPEQISKKKVDEYLVFIASEDNISWLNEYTQIEGLKSQMYKNKILMEKHVAGYIVIE